MELLDDYPEESCLQGSSKGSLQRPNRPQKLPGPEKPLLPTIIVTPSSPSLRAAQLHPLEFQHLVYAPPPPPRAPHPLFKPFASNPKRAKVVCLLLAAGVVVLMWHAWSMMSGETFRGTSDWGDVWAWVVERVGEVWALVQWAVGMVVEKLVEA